MDDAEKRRADVGYNVEYGVDSKGKYGQRNLARKEPDQSHDEILDIFIRCQSDNSALLSLSRAGAECLVDDDAVGERGRDES